MNYRDDVVDVITAGNGIHFKLKTTLNERLTTKDKSIGGSQDNLMDIARLFDGKADRTIITLKEQIGVSDAIFDKKLSHQMVVDTLVVMDKISRVYRDECVERIRISETLTQTLTIKIWLSDNLMIKDENRHIIKDSLSDEFKATSNTDTKRKRSDTLFDGIKTQESLYVGVRDDVSERATLQDKHQDQQGGKNTLYERLIIGDGVAEAFKKTSLLNDTLQAGDEIFDKMIAKNTLTDKAMVSVFDDVVQDTPNMAWTMNTVNQAMSQYAPFEIERVAVVDGVLYGENKDGVYRLDGVDETIIGVLATDKIDYGEQLIKPSFAYTEYQTDGAMKLTVHTTQKGVKQSYTYALPKERAGELTNGRFVFGRGLYGRQFAYTLTITARTALIYDLNVHFEKTNRRV